LGPRCANLTARTAQWSRIRAQPLSTRTASTPRRPEAAAVQGEGKATRPTTKTTTTTTTTITTITATTTTADLRSPRPLFPAPLVLARQLSGRPLPQRKSWLLNFGYRAAAWFGSSVLLIG